MPDYNKTIIYRIVCKDATITDCYIGHTTNIVKRRQEHKNICNMYNSQYLECIKLLLKFNHHIYSMNYNKLPNVSMLFSLIR